MSAPARHFATGALGFRLDGTIGLVRDIRYRGVEVLRGIYPAVRDASWATLAPSVGPVAANVSEDFVHLKLDARVRCGAGELTWQAEIHARGTGELRYRWRAQVLHEFSTNRTGLCVLHPAGLAGVPCVVEPVDGPLLAGWFPTTISPHQPWRNVRAITHVFAERAEITVRMEGEVFETEDQRNWTDASFKTYCRPLDWPRPFTLTAGTTIDHTVTVTIAETPLTTSIAGPAQRVAVGPVATRLPKIGFTLPSPLPASLLERVRALRPAHVQVVTTAAELPATAAWARTAAADLGCELILAVRDAGLRPPDRTLFPPHCTVHLFDGQGNSTSPDVLSAWRDAGFSSIGTGTLNHFAELNRQRPAANATHEFTSLGLNAQVHAFDDTSMLETLSQHRVVAEHAHRIGARRPVAAGPISLGPKADSPDPRLHSDFAALWILGSVLQLAAASCVERATYLQTHGPGGFLREEFVTPAEHLFRALAAITRAERLHFSHRDEPVFEGLLLTSVGGRRILIPNLTDEPVEIEVPYSGTAGTLGSPATTFAAGRVKLTPRSVWQLNLSS